MNARWAWVAGLVVVATGCTSAEFASSDGGGDGATDPDGGPAGVQPGAFGDLVITEIMFDTAIDDDCAEYFELYNPSADTTYDLGSCTVWDGSGSAAPLEGRDGGSVIMGPGDIVAFTNYNSATCPLFTEEELAIDRFGGFYVGVKFGNQVADGDRVEVACEGTVIDNVAYSQFGNDAYLEDFKGQAMSLDPGSWTAGANDMAADWCKAATNFRIVNTDVDFGSPGQENPPC